MSKRKPSPPRRSLRPLAESLETRQLLLTALRGLPTHRDGRGEGTDPDGAQWTLRFTGRGRSTSWAPMATPSPIDQELGRLDRHDHGRRSDHHRDPAGRNRLSEPDNGNANVYFQNLIVTPTGELGKIDAGQVTNFRTVQNGIAAIDMPDFYLAHTETTTPSDALADPRDGRCPPGEIYIPGRASSRCGSAASTPTTRRPAEPR